MSDILLNLFVLGVFILAGGLAFFMVRRQQAIEAQVLAQMAAENGWKLEHIREPLASGLRLAAPDWVFETVSHSSGQESGPGSSDVGQLTVWRAESSGTTLLIGPGMQQVNLGGMGEMLKYRALQLALGPHAEGVIEIQAGSEEFRKKYMVWARDAELVSRVITPSLEASLLAWRGPLPLIKRTSDGLEIRVNGTSVRKPDEILKVITLGKTLLALLS